METNASLPGFETVRGRSLDTLERRLRVLMVARVFFVVLLLGVTTYLQSRQKTQFIDRSLILLYGLCASAFFSTLLYAVALKRGNSLHSLGLAQLFVDVLFVNALIYITNGYDVFTFLYVVVIVAGSVILSRRWALVLAISTALSYGLLLTSQFFEILPRISFERLPVARFDDLVANIFYNSTSFLLVALLSGFLSEELQRARLRLREKQENLDSLENLNRNIVESLSSGLVTTNNDLLITSFNRCAEDLTGHRFEDVYFRPLNDVFPNIGHEMSQISSRWEDEYVRSQDNVRMVLGFSSSELKHTDGQPLGRILHFQDVTVLKRMQERMRSSDKLAAVGRLAAGMAHEIRNPLASISGSIQMLREQLNPAGEDRQLMDIVIRETERLNGLIREFLDFAKPRAANPSVVCLNEQIRQTTSVAKQHEKLRSSKSVHLDVVIPEKLLYVHADPDHLRQIVWNLFLNSLDAVSPENGRIVIRISQLNSGHSVLLEITDNGPGISAQNKDLVFEPFFTTKTQGTGMGLATVNRIVNEAGWELQLESQVGQGTTFRIIFPSCSQDVQPSQWSLVTP